MVPVRGIIILICLRGTTAAIQACEACSCPSSGGPPGGSRGPKPGILAVRPRRYPLSPSRPKYKFSKGEGGVDRYLAFGGFDWVGGGLPESVRWFMLRPPFFTVSEG